MAKRDDNNNFLENSIVTMIPEEESTLFAKLDELLVMYDSAYVQRVSFDHFINHRLPKIIQEEPKIVVSVSPSQKYVVQFGQVFVDKPYIIDENRKLRYIVPNEARLRDLTYSSLVSVNMKTYWLTKKEEKEDNNVSASVHRPSVVVESETTETAEKMGWEESDHKEFFKVCLARIPTMIGSSKCNLYRKSKMQKMQSKECKYDDGGYFIIKGKERVLVAQERMNYNIVHVFEQKLNYKYKYVAEIRSMSEETGHSVLVQMKLSNELDNMVYVQLPYISHDIPLAYIFMAYGCSMREIQWIMEFSMKKWRNNSKIRRILDCIYSEVQLMETKERAIQFIAQFAIHTIAKERRVAYILQILNNELFPHLGIVSTKQHKLFFLGHMFNKLVLTYLGVRSFDDRDHINNKRLELSGHLLSELFRTLFKRYIRCMEMQLMKRPDVMVIMSRNNMITQGIKHCFSTGNWGIPKSNYIRSGVSQILSRLTYNSFLSHLRRILIPIGKEGKNTKIRQLHPSQIGFICPFETPEGHCLTYETPILMGDGWSHQTMGALQSSTDRIMSVNVDSGERNPTRIHQYFKTSPKSIYQIRVYGRIIRSSPYHPFLVEDIVHNKIGWKYAKDLHSSIDRVACVPFLPLYPYHHQPQRRSRLEGFLKGLWVQSERRGEDVSEDGFYSVFLPESVSAKMILLECQSEWGNCRMRWEAVCRRLSLQVCIPLFRFPMPEEESDNRQFCGQRYDFLVGFFSAYCPYNSRLSSFSSSSLSSRDRTQNDDNYYYYYYSRSVCSIILDDLEEAREIQLFLREWANIEVDRVTSQERTREDGDRLVPFHHSVLLFHDTHPTSVRNFVYRFGNYYAPDRWMDLFLYQDFLHETQECLSFETFREQRVFVCQETRMIFYPIETIFCEERMEETFDFTTVHSNHTFIANGFVTHNSAGIVKNMAMTTQISTKTCSSFVKLILEEEFPDIIRDPSSYCTSSTDKKGEENMSGCNNSSYREEDDPIPTDYYKVFLDGMWIGICYSLEIFQKLRGFKDNRRFPPIVSISLNDAEQEILLFTDEGRMLRPLWSKLPDIETLRSKSIAELFAEKYIALYDSYEVENHVVAMTWSEWKTFPSRFSLCELHPSLMTGLCVALIPYAEHTQAPRIVYHASMGKQAVGYYATTCHDRVDTIAHLLLYPERPLIQTHIGESMGCDELVAGTNVIVAIAMYTGFNQEDSVIVNQSALDRGLFRSFAFRTLIVEERKKSSSYTETIQLPPLSLQIKSYNYTKLGADGIVKCGMFVGPSDVIVGRVQTRSSKHAPDETIDTSVTIKTGEEGYVDRIYLSTSPDGYRLVKLRVRTLKIPEIGDKLESREAQKGIIGMVYSQEDMPFCCQSGLIPDLIINPLCLPSRMTINQIIESIASKVSAQDGKKRYCTPFSSHSSCIVDSLIQALTDNGFRKDGKETMCNGFSGELFQADIFMGPTYYHRLKHLVSAKIHARNHGSLQVLTRQPVEGRSRDGGLRFGEMERDCMISHGVSRFLTERLFDMSDIYDIPLCSQCGTIPHSRDVCHRCESTQVRQVLLPYACKLLFQELMAMNIKLNLFPQNTFS